MQDPAPPRAAAPEAEAPLQSLPTSEIRSRITRTAVQLHRTPCTGAQRRAMRSRMTSLTEELARRCESRNPGPPHIAPQ